MTVTMLNSELRIKIYSLSKFSKISLANNQLISTWLLITRTNQCGRNYLYVHSTCPIPWPTFVVVDIYYPMVHSHYQNSNDDTPMITSLKSYNSHLLISMV
jgi:hypothetical protein